MPRPVGARRMPESAGPARLPPADFSQQGCPKCLAGRRGLPVSSEQSRLGDCLGAPVGELGFNLSAPSPE